MEESGLPPLIINSFCGYYKRVVNGETGFIFDRDISPVQEDRVENAEALTTYADVGEKAFGKTVRVILNGGLGTSMGLTQAKSLLKIKNNKTFLELILRDAERLMGNASTHSRDNHPTRPGVD